MQSPLPQNTEIVDRIAEQVQARNLRIAVAESLTGGLLCSHLASGPDSSAWFLGGVVAYSRQVKSLLLGVPNIDLVSAQVAVVMAESALELTGADVSLGITGVGGPEPQGIHDAGTVFISVASAQGSRHTERLSISGSVSDVLAESVTRSLDMLLASVRQS